MKMAAPVLPAMLPLHQWRWYLNGLLTLGTLCLIGWAGVVIWQQRCGAALHHASAGGLACGELVAELDTVLIAATFWAIGLAAGRLERRQLPIEFFFVGAGVLAAGTLSGQGNDGGSRLLYFFLAWLVPLTVHFHLVLAGRTPGATGRGMLLALYLLAACLALPVLSGSFATLEQQVWFDRWRIAIRLCVACALIVAIALLVHTYRQRGALARRRTIRLVVFGTLLAFAPMLLLSFLPDTLGWDAAVPYAWTFPWLLLSPLSYGYTLFQRRLIWAEGALARATSSYLLIIMVLGGYLAGMILLRQAGANTFNEVVLSHIVLVGALLLALGPLRGGIQRLTTWIWYGDISAYVSMLERMAAALAQTLDRATLRRLLVDDLAAELQLAGSALLLRDQDNSFGVVGSTGCTFEALVAVRVPHEARLCSYLQAAATPVQHVRLHQDLAPAACHPAEQALLRLPEVAVWLPLVSDGTLYGMVLIGARDGDEDLTAFELRMLATLAHQAGSAAHNVELVDQLRAHQHAIAVAHRQVLSGREQERQRLAQELHDGPVQQLLGLTYLLAGLRSTLNPDGDAPLADNSRIAQARREVLDVVAQLRALISDLRPAGLKELGLSAALSGYVARLERDYGPGAPEIIVDVDHQEIDLPEVIATSLFRIAQEALRNAVRHARARRIALCLRVAGSSIWLYVRDDGRGFHVPAQLSELAQANHFGLLGMAERVEGIGGQLDVRSYPGMGTEVVVRIPLPEHAAPVESAASR